MKGFHIVYITTVLAIVAPLVLAFHLKKKRKFYKELLSYYKAVSQFGLVEECNLVLPNES